MSSCPGPAQVHAQVSICLGDLLCPPPARIFPVTHPNGEILPIDVCVYKLSL